MSCVLDGRIRTCTLVCCVSLFDIVHFCAASTDTFSCAQVCCRSSVNHDMDLPYELRALEAALATATRVLEVEAVEIEKRTMPALKGLLQKVWCRAHSAHVA